MTVVTEATIEFPIEKVWALVGDFAGLLRWHPNLGVCDVREVNGATERRVQFKNDGRWVVERLVRRDPDAYYFEYVMADAQDPSVIGLAADITLTATEDGQTHLKWISAKGADFSPQMRADLDIYYAQRVEHLRDALRNDQ